MKDLADLCSYASAVVVAMFGRAVALAMMQPPLTWALLWEFPACVGMGIIGSGIADYLGLHGHQNGAVVAAVAYFGPRGLNAVFSVALRRSGK